MVNALQAIQRGNQQRPPLPQKEYNQKLREPAITAGVPPVKFQIILREGQEIIVGRVKVPTPGGHAFILRRFDTGAVSLSTMFRAAFPTANDASEKEETAWVKSSFETAGSNGGGKLRLAGTWVPPQVALGLAQSYGLDHILPALAEAVPEQPKAYRKSNGTPSKVSNTASAAAVANGVSIPTTLPPVGSTTPQGTPVKRENLTTPGRAPPTKKSRRSASPASQSLKVTPIQPSRSSPRRLARVEEPREEEEEEEEADVPSPNPETDIQEAKEEVARLRAEHLAAQAHREAAEAQAQAVVPSTPSKGKKRNIEQTETPPFKLDLEKIQEAAQNVVGEAMELVPARPIISRRRLGNLPPTQKAAVWGGVVFFLGLGASTLFPSLLPGGGFW